MCPQVSENQAARFMAGRAEIIDELEGSMPAWLRRRTMSSCYPTYIHFLKVNTAFTTIVCIPAQYIILRGSRPMDLMHCPQLVLQVSTTSQWATSLWVPHSPLWASWLAVLKTVHACLSV